VEYFYRFDCKKCEDDMLMRVTFRRLRRLSRSSAFLFLLFSLDEKKKPKKKRRNVFMMRFVDPTPSFHCLHILFIFTYARRFFTYLKNFATTVSSIYKHLTIPKTKKKTKIVGHTLKIVEKKNNRQQQQLERTIYDR
jgi:hypothetical protein